MRSSPNRPRDLEGKGVGTARPRVTAYPRDFCLRDGLARTSIQDATIGGRCNPNRFATAGHKHRYK